MGIFRMDPKRGVLPKARRNRRSFGICNIPRKTQRCGFPAEIYGIYSNLAEDRRRLSSSLLSSRTSSRPNRRCIAKLVLFPIFFSNVYEQTCLRFSPVSPQQKGKERFQDDYTRGVDEPCRLNSAITIKARSRMRRRSTGCSRKYGGNN